MKSILLVEDDPFIGEIYETKLKEAGFEVKIAKDAQKALIFLEEQKPDLVLLDIVLPNIDGWELLKKIRKDERLKNTKVIILSNLEQKPHIEKGLQLGADSYLIKAHYTPSQVIQEIKSVLEK